jgi:hypothetical protein
MSSVKMIVATTSNADVLRLSKHVAESLTNKPAG